MRDWEVRLTPEQLRDADAVAQMVSDGYTTGRDQLGRAASMKYSPKGRTIAQVSYDSLPAELAVAARTAQPWNRGDRERCDVGRRTEVRHSKRGNWLFLYRYDHDERLYVLTTGERPYYQLLGWIQGRDGRIERYHRRPGEPGVDVESWWISPHELRPMRTFPDLGESASRGLQPAHAFLPRRCPSCDEWHPVLTTCAGGWNPYKGA